MDGTVTITPTNSKYDYGRAGWFGIGTPMANPTVEGELRLLMPHNVLLQVSRLVSDETSSKGRLIDYIRKLPAYMKTYNILKLDAYGFACTASSYLVGLAEERDIVKRVEDQVGYRVITAPDAILEACEALKVSRVALAAPYPDDVIDSGAVYWKSRGLDVVAKHRLVTASSTDTRTIYMLTSEDANAAFDKIDHAKAEAVVLSGTGMPSLNILHARAKQIGKPVLSSNYSLAWALLKTKPRGVLPKAFSANAYPLLSGFETRLAEALNG
jgi:maleate isomerase